MGKLATLGAGAAVVVLALAGRVVADPAPVKRDQPPQIKLKLGHFSNARLGIGVTIDLTQTIDNVAKVPPGKLRFDGDAKVWQLTGQRDGSDLIDYTRDHGALMLQVWRDGRHAVYVPDPTSGKSSDAIAVVRDGDADPL
jgi:hypothetical protein